MGLFLKVGEKEIATIRTRERNERVRKEALKRRRKRER